MKAYVFTTLDVLLLYVMGHIAKFIFNGEFASPSTDQLIFAVAALALLRSNRKGGAA